MAVGSLPSFSWSYFNSLILDCVKLCKSYNFFSTPQSYCWVCVLAWWRDISCERARWELARVPNWESSWMTMASHFPMSKLGYIRVPSTVDCSIIYSSFHFCASDLLSHGIRSCKEIKVLNSVSWSLFALPPRQLCRNMCCLYLSSCCCWLIAEALWMVEECSPSASSIAVVWTRVECGERTRRRLACLDNDSVPIVGRYYY